MEKNSS